MNEKSTKKQSRKEKKAATRNALKRAAKRCFEEKGFVQTQIGDITRQAGVAQGTYYVHFSNKDELLDDILKEFNTGLILRFTSTLGESLVSLEHWVKQCAKIFLEYWQEHRDFVGIYVQKTAEGLSLEALRDGLNPEATEFLFVRLNALLGQDNEKTLETWLVLQGLLAMWLRIGMQYLFNPEITEEIALQVLIDATGGVLKGAFPSVSW